MEAKNISDELWREYDFLIDGEHTRIYRIDNPTQLYVGNTTHRIVGSDGTVHCVPAPGQGGCVLRWKTKDATKPVSF